MDPGFVNNAKTNTVDMQNPLIFISTSKIDTIRQLETILREATSGNRALLIIADVDPQVAVYLIS